MFQRTANFSLPARNAPMDPEKRAQAQGRVSRARRAAAYGHAVRHRRLPAADQVGAGGPPEEERNDAYEAKWAGRRQHQLPLFLHRPAGEQGRRTTPPRSSCATRSAASSRIRQTAELLAPKDHPIGTKRLCLDTNYYETYNRDNVTLVDVRSAPIEEITATGLRHARGASTSSMPSSSPPASTP